MSCPGARLVTDSRDAIQMARFSPHSDSTSQAEQALGRSLRSLARAAGLAYSPAAVRAHQSGKKRVAPNPLSTKPLLKGDSPSAGH